MPRNDQLATLVCKAPRIVDGKINQQDWNDFIRTLTNLDLRSGATGFNAGTGYFIGFNNGFPCFFIGEAGGKNLRYSAENGNLYLDKGTLVIDGTEIVSIAYGVQYGTANDGDAILFSPSYENVPAVILGDGGISYSATLGAVDTQRIIQAQNLTATGFTLKAKLGDLGAPVSRSFNFSGVFGTTDTATKTLAAEAYDDVYLVNYTMRVEPGNTGVVEISTKPSTGTYTARATISKTNNSAVIRDYTIATSITVDGLDAGAMVQVAATDCDVAGATVDYTENTITEVTATPAGATGISWLAIGGT